VEVFKYFKMERCQLDFLLYGMNILEFSSGVPATI
jgi:hypothetical protein